MDGYEMAERVQHEMESYDLRNSIDGRRRVLAEALREAYRLGTENADEALRRGMDQMRLLAGLPLPPDIIAELEAARAVVERATVDGWNLGDACAVRLGGTHWVDGYVESIGRGERGGWVRVCVPSEDVTVPRSTDGRDAECFRRRYDDATRAEVSR